MRDYLLDVYDDIGFLSNVFPRYECRDGQLAIADAIDRGLSEGRHVLAEGPCGVGKSLAYAVPAVWHAHHAKKRTIIVTANIALQEQLVSKDLPTLARALPWTFTFGLLKGRNNFLCAEKFDAIAEARKTIAPEDEAHFGKTWAWARHTQTGDVSELPFVPSKRVWDRFAVTSEECTGDGCAFRSQCFAERAKAKSETANIVVTNYHMLFAHLALRKESGEDLVLPRFDALILDEAHEAAAIARDFFGSRVTGAGIAVLAKKAEGYSSHLAEALRKEGAALFHHLAWLASSKAYDVRLRRPHFADVEPVCAPLRALASQASKLADALSAKSKERSQALQVARRALRAANHLTQAAALADPNAVYWLEPIQEGRVALCSRPIYVADLLREELFDRCASVSLVSATLTTSGTFRFIRRQTGIPDTAMETVAESPFDFKNQALLVVPQAMPSTDESTFVDAAASAFRTIIRHCGGRTLGLFTSNKNLEAVHQRVKAPGLRYLRQGELPRPELTRIFKEDISSCLFGTDSFWTGIDVPGEALTAVVIDKLPFESPADPVMDAIAARDPNAFRNVFLPTAIIAFRQGVGRLIRSQRDVGVVVVLDNRLVNKGYGAAFRKSLPRMPFARTLDAIPNFLAHAKASAA